MQVKYQYKKWGIFLATSLGVVLLTLYFSIISVPVAKLVVGVGGPLGVLFGVSAWWIIRKGIDQRNVVVIYTIEGFWYATVLVPLGAGLLGAPIGMGPIFHQISKNPDVFYGVMLFVLSMNVGYNLVLFGAFFQHEHASGPVRVKEIYSPSISGREGMVGMVATVVDECNPRGRVQVENELWNAVSLKGTLRVGEDVVVKDLEGLTLLVE